MDTPEEIKMRPVSEWQNPKPIVDMHEFITRILYGLFRQSLQEGGVPVIIQQDLQQAIRRMESEGNLGEDGLIDFRKVGVPIVNLTPETILAVWSVISYESKGVIPMQPHNFFKVESGPKALN